MKDEFAPDAISPFYRALLQEALDSPTLLSSIAGKLSGPSYSIPTGNSFKDFRVEDGPMLDKRLKLFQKAMAEARAMTIEDLAHVLDELREEYLAFEAQGRELNAVEQTLRDIDILSLAVLAILNLDCKRKGIL